MRTRTWLILVSVFASSMGTLAAGCGDDTTTPPPPAEAGGVDSSSGGGDATKADTSTADAPKDSPAEAAKEAAACVDASVNIATFDSGSAIWSCFQGACGPSLGSCAADCTCNTLFATALNCVAEGGIAQTMACFTPAITMGGDAALNWYTGCYMMNMGCNDASAAPPSEGGEAGEAGDTGAGEGGTDGGTDAEDAG